MTVANVSKTFMMEEEATTFELTRSARKQTLEGKRGGEGVREYIDKAHFHMHANFSKRIYSYTRHFSKRIHTRHRIISVRVSIYTCHRDYFRSINSH